MAKNVKIKCRHCSASNEIVSDVHAIPGVDDTYIQRAIDQHKSGFKHGVNFGSNQLGLKPKPEKIKAKLDNFNHGKDHNA